MLALAGDKPKPPIFGRGLKVSKYIIGPGPSRLFRKKARWQNLKTPEASPVVRELDETARGKGRRRKASGRKRTG